jgi:L-alanine-DL-glutamate epimerase-like enolase superfamily enzyme
MAFGRALRQCAAAACEWLEYVEEPLVATESARSGEWSTLTGLPFALDESVENLTRESLLPLMLQDGCAAVVLKPTLVGGIEAAAGLATVARARGKRVVMTNAFESGVAHCHVTLWCGAFGGTGVAHGLNTYERLASDLLPTPFGELVERHLVSVERAQAALDELCDRELM